MAALRPLFYTVSLCRVGLSVRTPSCTACVGGRSSCGAPEPACSEEPASVASQGAFASKSPRFGIGAVCGEISTLAGSADDAVEYLRLWPRVPFPPAKERRISACVSSGASVPLTLWATAVGDLDVDEGGEAGHTLRNLAVSGASRLNTPLGGAQCPNGSPRKSSGPRTAAQEPSRCGISSQEPGHRRPRRHLFRACSRARARTR